MAGTPSLEPPVATAFSVFVEIGIIGQLSTALLEARLPKGLVAAQFAVLNHLSSRPDGETPLQLARAFQVPKTSMSHSLAVLDERGLIAMAPNPVDARSKIVQITPAGLAFRTDVIAALGPDIAHALADLDPGTLDRLLPLLRHVRHVMDRARDG